MWRSGRPKDLKWPGLEIVMLAKLKDSNRERHSISGQNTKNRVAFLLLFVVVVPVQVTDICLERRYQH